MAKKPHVQVYRSYRFRDKDPIIDRVRTAIQESGMSYQDIHNKEGIATTTLYNWMSGPTRRPQFCTVMAVLRSCGVDLKETPYSLRNGKK